METSENPSGMAFPMTKREKPWERGCKKTIVGPRILLQILGGSADFYIPVFTPLPIWRLLAKVSNCIKFRKFVKDDHFILTFKNKEVLVYNVSFVPFCTGNSLLFFKMTKP
jgi:hypothetical protein